MCTRESSSDFPLRLTSSRKCVFRESDSPRRRWLDAHKRKHFVVEPIVVCVNERKKATTSERSGPSEKICCTQFARLLSQSTFSFCLGKFCGSKAPKENNQKQRLSTGKVRRGKGEVTRLKSISVKSKACSVESAHRIRRNVEFQSQTRKKNAAKIFKVSRGGFSSCATST